MKTCGSCGWSEGAHGAVLSSIPKNPPCGQFQPLSEYVETTCPSSRRVDDPTLHSTRFDGDDPYTICVYCGETRDALTGRIVKQAKPEAPKPAKASPVGTTSTVGNDADSAGTDGKAGSERVTE